MNRSSRSVRILAALLPVLHWAPAASALEQGEVIPPTYKPPSREELGNCYPVSARRLSTEGRVALTLTISPSGRVTRIELPPESDPWMQEAADCIIPKLEFQPGTLDGKPTEARATLNLAFNLQEPTGASTPPAVTLPTVSSGSDEILDIYRMCYPPDLEVSAQVVYKITISKGGKLFHPELIEGSGRDRIDQAGLCILEKLRFSPARRDGRAVVATLSWPLLVRPPPDQ